MCGNISTRFTKNSKNIYDIWLLVNIRLVYKPNISNKETFLQDFLVILKRPVQNYYKILNSGDSDVINRLKYPITHWCVAVVKGLICHPNHVRMNKKLKCVFIFPVMVCLQLASFLVVCIYQNSFFIGILWTCTKPVDTSNTIDQTSFMIW